MVAVVGLVLESRGGVRRWERLFRLPAVEVAVAAAGSAFEGGGVSGSGSRGRHELAATVDGVASQAGGVVLEAFLVSNQKGSMWVVVVVVAVVVEAGVVVVEVVVDSRVALEDAVRERRGLRWLDPRWGFGFSFGGFDRCSGGDCGISDS